MLHPSQWRQGSGKCCCHKRRIKSLNHTGGQRSLIIFLQNARNEKILKKQAEQMHLGIMRLSGQIQFFGCLFLFLKRKCGFFHVCAVLVGVRTLKLSIWAIFLFFSLFSQSKSSRSRKLDGPTCSDLSKYTLHSGFRFVAQPDRWRFCQQVAGRHPSTSH